MKTLIIALTALSLSGCATWAKTEMQPDHSYRIESTGQDWASHAKVKKTAYNAADGLCPKGYDKSAAFGEDSMYYTLIVLCKDRTSIRVSDQ